MRRRLQLLAEDRLDQDVGGELADLGVERPARRRASPSPGRRGRAPRRAGGRRRSPRSPPRRPPRTARKTCSISTSVRVAVGSSRIRMRASRPSARAISTSWRGADRELVDRRCRGRRRSRPTWASSSAARRRARRAWRRKPGADLAEDDVLGDATASGPGSAPGRRWRCRRAARRGDRRRTRASPSSRISPASGATLPASMLISVLLPAPLWPQRPWISPAPIVSETSRTACTAAEALGRGRAAPAGAALRELALTPAPRASGGEISRFRIFPVGPFGSSSRVQTRRGYLYGATRSFSQSRSSPGSALAPGARTTAAPPLPRGARRASRRRRLRRRRVAVKTSSTSRG